MKINSTDLARFTIVVLAALTSLSALAQGNVETKSQPPVLDAEMEKLYSIPHLTGEELLCELDTPAYSGIFALDIKKGNSLPFPLVADAHSPQWGPKHKAFTFIRAGLVWVGDCEGRIQPVGLIPRYAQNFRMFWDPSLKAFALYDAPGWTKVFARSINFSEDLAVQRLKERKRINLRFSEKIIMRDDPSQKEKRFLEYEDGNPPVKTQLQFAVKVRPTEAVAFSPDALRFVMQLGDGLSYGHSSGSHLWLFNTIESNVKDPGYSREKFEKIIADNDYSRFYTEDLIVPRATFVKELTGQNKEVFEMQPSWSPDGKMLAYAQINPSKEEVWPHVLMGEKLEKDVAISIPNYMPFAEERWARKSVEVLFWGPNGDLFLIEGTRDKIYRAKLTDKGFAASSFIEIISSGKPTLLHPVLHGDWFAYTLSLDDAMTLHLKNTRTGEERVLPLAVNGSGQGVVQHLNW